MLHSAAARLAWYLFWLSPVVTFGLVGAPTDVPNGVPVFLDSLETGDDCRWSAANPPEPGSCSDLLPNGCETDVDCGGRTCPTCDFGFGCREDTDCISGICFRGSCDIAYELSVSHSGGGSVTSSPAGIDCGAACSALFGAGTQVTLTATPDGDALFLGWSGACSAETTCSVTVAEATSVMAHFGHAITVARNGTGSVTSVPAGIDCGVTCTGAFEHGSAVTLAARTANGSNSFFSGWAGDCAAAGPFRDCQLTVDAPRSVTADFSSRDWNLAFVSSVPISPTLGSAEAYDIECNLLASAAGINNVAGTGYMAWTSSAASNAGSRLGSARGWVKMDGTPFADSQTALLSGNEIFQPLDLDETGMRRASEYVMTGTWPGGTANQDNCADWGLFSAWVAVGSTAAGPVRWTYSYSRPCTASYRIYCLGTTRNVALTPPVAAGKKIWLSDGVFIPDPTTTPDDTCAADQPGARAVVARTTLPASATIDPASTYVRMNGQIVGTGAEIIAAGWLQSGIWQHHNGTYLDYYEATVWSGSNGDLTALGTRDGTCNDWTYHGGSPAARISETAFIDSLWWNGWTGTCSNWTRHLICVEP